MSLLYDEAFSELLDDKYAAYLMDLQVGSSPRPKRPLGKWSALFALSEDCKLFWKRHQSKRLLSMKSISEAT